MNGTSLGQASTFGGAGPIGDAWVAATDKVIALLARAPQGTSGANRRFILDGGDDGGEAVDATAPDSGGGTTFVGSTLLLNVVAAGTPLGSLGAPIATPGNWGSLAAQAGRASSSATRRSRRRP